MTDSPCFIRKIGFDIETTGHNPFKNKLAAIGVAIVDHDVEGNPVITDTKSWRVGPPPELPVETDGVWDYKDFSKSCWEFWSHPDQKETLTWLVGDPEDESRNPEKVAKELRKYLDDAMLTAPHGSKLITDNPTFDGGWLDQFLCSLETDPVISDGSTKLARIQHTISFSIPNEKGVQKYIGSPFDISVVLKLKKLGLLTKDWDPEENPCPLKYNHRPDNDAANIAWGCALADKCLHLFDPAKSYCPMRK